jgi:hypothetical protein
MALDKNGISTAIADCLKADTGTLYGTSKLLQIIEGDPRKFDKAKIDNKNRYALYLWCRNQDPLEIRSQNEYTNYFVNVRIEGLETNPQTALQNMDDAWERIAYLINNQMWAGLYMTSYYTDANAQIYNIEPTTAVLPEPEQKESFLTCECEGAILVQVNRWK